MKKVKRGRIIQDTGSGGAWPVSSDRTTWALAAWEIYKTTGDRTWLKQAYEIIKNSVEDDYKVIYDKTTGMYSGESSFLDWREQTYPKWMNNADIYVSQNLGTNAVKFTDRGQVSLRIERPKQSRLSLGAGGARSAMIAFVVSESSTSDGWNIVVRRAGSSSSSVGVSSVIAIPARSQPCDPATSRSSPSVSASVTYMTVSPRAAPARRNCSASVVLPEPGTPSTRNRRFLVNPPRRTSSRPSMPVAAGWSCALVVSIGYSRAHWRERPAATKRTRRTRRFARP